MKDLSTDIKEFAEDCWFIRGVKVGGCYVGKRVYHARGSTASVDFDWQEAWDKKILGWFHTHPGEHFVHPSSTDHKTMRGWVRALGRPLLCGILSGDDYACYEYFPPKKGEDTVYYIVRECALMGDWVFVSNDRRETRLEAK